MSRLPHTSQTGEEYLSKRRFENHEACQEEAPDLRGGTLHHLSRPRTLPRGRHARVSGRRPALQVQGLLCGEGSDENLERVDAKHLRDYRDGSALIDLRESRRSDSRDEEAEGKYDSE